MADQRRRMREEWNKISIKIVETNSKCFTESKFLKTGLIDRGVGWIVMIYKYYVYDLIFRPGYKTEALPQTSLRKSRFVLLRQILIFRTVLSDKIQNHKRPRYKAGVPF